MTNRYDCLINPLRVMSEDNVQKIATHQGDYYNKHYKLIAIDLSKQQRLDTDPKAIQQIDFTGNQFQTAGATMFSFVFFPFDIK